VNTLLPVVLVLLAAGGSLAVLGLPVLPLVLAMFAGLAFHLQRFRDRLPPAERVLPVYLGALVWQLLHFVEELLTGFAERFPVLLGADPWSTERFVAFNLVHDALFLLSAIAYLKRVPWLAVFASFFLVAMFLNGLGHAGLALWVGGYFPGLVTGLVSPLFGVWLLRRLRVDGT